MQEIRRFQGTPHEVWAVAISPDGKDLVSGGRDGTVRYWEPVAKPPPHRIRFCPWQSAALDLRSRRMANGSSR